MIAHQRMKDTYVIPSRSPCREVEISQQLGHRCRSERILLELSESSIEQKQLQNPTGTKDPAHGGETATTARVSCWFPFALRGPGRAELIGGPTCRFGSIIANTVLSSFGNCKCSDSETFFLDIRYSSIIPIVSNRRTDLPSLCGVRLFT